MDIYAEVKIPLMAEILFVENDITFAFIDIQYFAKYRADLDHINGIMKKTPSWARIPWKKGRMPTLAKFFEIKDNGQLYSITGYEGEALFRALIIDKKNHIIYFEMREY